MILSSKDRIELDLNFDTKPLIKALQKLSWHILEFPVALYELNNKGEGFIIKDD